jgi:hypothetical protein
MGDSRDSFYRYKQLFGTGGSEALEELTRRKPNEKNRVPHYIEEAVLALTIEDPSLGQAQISFAKLYVEKTAMTAADLLNDRVIPWFSDQDVLLLRILTDRGTEYCGKVDSHAYQLYLAVENIDHSKTKVTSPQTNGMCERFHKTIKNEFYDIA